MKITLPVGVHQLSVKEHPYAQGIVRVLTNALPLVFDPETGLIEATPIAPGEYKIAFFLGAKPLRIQPLSVPRQGGVSVTASISANEVVTVSLRTGIIENFADLEAELMVDSEPVESVDAGPGIEEAPQVEPEKVEDNQEEVPLKEEAVQQKSENAPEKKQDSKDKKPQGFGSIVDDM